MAIFLPVTLASDGTTPSVPANWGQPVYLGVNLAAISLLPATQLTFTTPGTQIINVGTSISVQALDVGGLNAYTFAGVVTLSKVSGPGAITGATTATAVHGVATFPAVAFDTPGAYVIRFSASGLTSATSTSITVNNYVTYFTEPFTFSGNLDGHVSGGYTWAETTAGVLVATGTVLASTTYTSGAKHGVVTLPSADGSISANLSSTGGNPVALIARQSDISNYWYGVLFPGNGYYLHKVVAGSDTTLYRCYDNASGDLYGLRCKGSSVFLTVNGYPVYGVEDSFNQTALGFGVKALHASDTWDNCVTDGNAPYIINSAATLPDSDTFTRANGELGATANGRAWMTVRETANNLISINSNKATSVTGGLPQAWVKTNSANGTIKVLTTAGSTSTGIMGRASEDNVQHLWLYDNGATTLYTYCSVEYGDYTNGLELIMRNNRVAARRNGVVVAQGYIPTPLAANVNHGLFGQDVRTWTGFNFTTATTGLSDPGTIVNTPFVTLDGNSVMSGAGIAFDTVRPTVPGDDIYRPCGSVIAAFPDVDVFQYSISGTTTPTRTSAASANGLSGMLNASTGRTAKKICILYEGTNDGTTTSITATDVYNHFNAYATAMLGYGADEVWNMLYLPRTDRSSAVDAIRVQSNRWQRGLDTATRPAALTFTGIIDVPTLTVGTPFLPTDDIAGVTTATPTYWQGGLHPSKQGHDLYFNPTIINALKAYFAFGKPSVQFSASSGGASPSSQSLSLNVSGAWTVAAATLSGGSWLSVTPTSGTGATTLTVSAATGALALGLYTGTITLTNGGVTTVLPVSFAVNAAVASATHLAFSQQPVATGKTIAFATMPKVQALLAGGGVDTGYTANVTLGITSSTGGTAGAGATLGGTVTVAAVAGVADFTSAGLSLNQGGTAYQLHATSGALTAADSGAFDVASLWDAFTRADVNPLDAAPTGQTYTNDGFGKVGITSNVAKPKTNGDGFAHASGGSANGVYQVTLVAGMSNNVGGVFRYSATSDHWMIRNLTGTTQLYKRVANGYTLVGSQSGGADGDVMKVVLSGSSITCYRNGTSIITTTDSFNSTATEYGLCAVSVDTTSTQAWDDLSFVPA